LRDRLLAPDFDFFAAAHAIVPLLVRAIPRRIGFDRINLETARLG